MTVERGRGRPKGSSRPVPADLLVRLEGCVLQVASAQHELDERRRELAGVIREAAAAGGSVRSIAEAVGTSPSTVASILAAE